MNRSTSNKYRNKLFSILGDSISTFENYNHPAHPVYYKWEKLPQNGLCGVEDTWWYKVIDYFGGKLLVNGSRSGGTVVKLPQNDCLYPSGCSEERIEELSSDGVDPSVIMVYLGTNDWAYGAYESKNHPYEGFCPAYRLMLENLKKRYPDSEVWCISLNEWCLPSRSYAKFEPVLGDEHIEKYNMKIKEGAEEYDCVFLDIYSQHVPYSTKDGAHPDRDGMKTLGELVISQVEKTVLKNEK